MIKQENNMTNSIGKILLYEALDLGYLLNEEDDDISKFNPYDHDVDGRNRKLFKGKTPQEGYNLVFGHRLAWENAIKARKEYKENPYGKGVRERLAISNRHLYNHPLTTEKHILKLGHLTGM